MKEKRNKDDYTKIKTIVNLYPKSERALVESIARLNKEVKISRAELSARHHIKIAQTIRQLWTTDPNTSDQNQQCAIVVLEGGIPIHVKDDPLLGEYKAGFNNAQYVTNEFVIFDATQEESERGGVYFEFPKGLPKCKLYFWVTWGDPWKEEVKIKIGCYVWALPTTVEPSQPIEKYTDQTKGFFAGVDMIWTVVSPNDYIAFRIKNNHHHSILHYYTTLLALLD